jgi:hypothetical protein
MAYKVIINARAQKEIEESINFYDLYSDVAPIYFVTALKKAYSSLEQNPFLGKGIRVFEQSNLAVFLLIYILQ